MKGLQKLGVSEDDVRLAEGLMKQIPTCPLDPNKAERIFGFASSRLAREKALRMLGATEEDVELENAKNMGSLGIGGRRRSYAVLETTSSSKPIYVSGRPTKPRRHTSIDLKSKQELRILRSHAKASASEIMTLKARIDELESLVQRVTSLQSTDSRQNSRASIVDDD
eukprot:CCRYP_004958-RA/>CCRYP_004958-RA protein AED:0.02 eAED:-0.01 QI:0/0/0/1/1/1/2/0/167